MEELKTSETEALDIIESLLDVADMKNTGPMYADDPPRSGMCRIPEDDAAKLRQYIAARRAAPENSDYMDGVKYAIYEIFKEADISGSQEIRDSGDTDDGMCARAAEKIRAELYAAPENKPLTLEQLRQMDGEPVWIKADHYGIYADIVNLIGKEDGENWVSFKINYRLRENGYGKTRLAYANRPEGT